MLASARLSALTWPVSDPDRAARFFQALVAAPATTTDEPPPVVALFTQETTGSAKRLCFETEDISATRARMADLTGGDATADAQGLGLRLCARGQAVVADADQRRGPSLGPVILLAPDVSAELAFYREASGLDFTRVGSGDFWWIVNGPPLGIFPAGHDLTNPDVPRPRASAEIEAFLIVDDLAAARRQVETLGGRTLSEGHVGHYQIARCEDDQGTTFGLWSEPA